MVYIIYIYYKVVLIIRKVLRVVKNFKNKKFINKRTMCDMFPQFLGHIMIKSIH